MACVANSWLPVRNAAIRVLRLLPTPLLGLQQAPPVLRVLKWAAQLLHSPRPFEADAGAQVVSFLHDAYVLQLGWNISLFPELDVELPTISDESIAEQPDKRPLGLLASLKFIQSLESAVVTAVSLAESDMVAACRHSFLQGKLLVLQHALTTFPWGDVQAHGIQVSYNAAPFSGVACVPTCVQLLPKCVQQLLSGAIQISVLRYCVDLQVVDGSKLLISSLVELLLRAAGLCVPFLDGRHNVDADEVLPDDGLLAAAANPSEEQSKDSAERRDGEPVDVELGPNVTVLVTGEFTCPQICILVYCE